MHFYNFLYVFYSEFLSLSNCNDYKVRFQQEDDAEEQLESLGLAAGLLVLKNLVTYTHNATMIIDITFVIPTCFQTLTQTHPGRFCMQVPMTMPSS